MVVHKYDDFYIGESSPNGFYVYGWACEDWGGVFFYVGKGCKNRYASLHNRNQTFMKIIEKWNCFPVIFKQGLTEEQALKEERNYKIMFALEQGHPIIDDEGDSRKQLVIRKRKEELRNQGVRVDGRPEKVVPISTFKKFFQKQKEKELTVNECCAALEISRTKWYNMCKEVAL